MLVTALNLALTKHLAADVTQMLTGKKLRLCVTDTQWAFDFEWLNGRFRACQNKALADLTISASAYDFILLGTRKEDPDALFFSRRLVVEGDTELGLIAKNTLDAVELPKLDLSHLMPGPVLERTASRLLAAGR